MLGKAWIYRRLTRFCTYLLRDIVTPGHLSS